MTCPFKTLYERIGGHAAVLATVTKLYGKILEDERLIPFFENIDVEKLRSSQYEFVKKAFGGPSAFQNQDIRRAHANLVKNGLNSEHFDLVAGHLQSVLKELNVPEDMITEALLIIDSTRDDVLKG